MTHETPDFIAVQQKLAKGKSAALTTGCDGCVIHPLAALSSPCMLHFMNFMPARHAEALRPQRAEGALALRFKRTGATTRIETFFQQGCLKTRLPRPVNAAICEAITMNISGGIAGGDSLFTSITLGTGARAIVSTQAAERLYRALAEPARITTRITLQEGTALDYLPQETILFDGFGLNRSLDIALAEDASFLGLESLVFGRLAMGEAVQTGHLRDRITLRRGGKLVLQDMTRLDGDINAALQRQAVAAGATAVATIIAAGPGAVEKLTRLREALGDAHAGASAFEGLILARILAPNAASLRQTILRALAVLQNGRALPKTWQG